MGHPISVLHVDDDPSMTDLTATFLERANDRFTVETAASADEGLERINDRPPDGVISDYNMPGMDGLEFLQTVRKKYPRLPFILFTGKGSETVASDAIAAGVTDYLQKESGTEQYELLANRIRNAVEAKHEAQRADRQEELMRLTEFAGDTGGFELNVETGDILLTDGATRILSVPEEPDLTLENGLQQFHPDDRPAIRQTIDRTLQTGEQTDGTWRYEPTDGEKKFLNIRFTPVGDGNTATLRGAIHDITERRQRERRFQALVTESNDIISVVDTDGVYQYQSPSLERILGYDPEETIGEQAWEYIHPDDRDAIIATFEEWVNNPETKAVVEYRARHADGSWRWMEARGNNQLENPAVSGYVVNSRDITERRRREQRLQEIKEQYQTLVENFPDGAVFLYDTDLRIVRAGGTELAEVGLSLAEIEGKTPHDRYPPEISEVLVDHIENTLDGESQTFEQEYEGEHYRIQTVPVRTDDGKISHAMAVSLNITDQVADR